MGPRELKVGLLSLNSILLLFQKGGLKKSNELRDPKVSYYFGKFLYQSC